ncbi:hypothetical protein ACFQZE_16825 [Paenibacillus sp. GCM10027627]|uniref:hypothetical protein n=1 Tax=unclassified Paenibacillus TaxID=185978 RepID=UPI003633AB48
MSQMTTLSRLAAAIIVTVAVLPFGLINGPERAEAAHPPAIRLIVKASPDSDYESSIPLAIPSLLEGASASAEAALPAVDTFLTMNKGAEKTEYRLDADGHLHSKDGEKLTLKPATRQKLLAAAKKLRASHYGELLPWKEARSAVPRKAVVTVIDLETGLRFKAQRRAGSSHADVQPLTKADTEIMKTIYNGEWSWHRRAIVVEANGRKIASSMHGMPHGGDGIPDNGFSGHFCIHFEGSTTHRSGQVDLGHQLMVAKASGTLDAFFRRLGPYETIDAFFLANEYGDHGLMAKLFPDAEHPEAAKTHFGAEEGKIRHHYIDAETSADEGLALDVALETCIARASGCSGRAKSVFHLRRMSPIEPWRIDGIFPFS